MKKRFTTLVLSVLLALAGALGFLSFSASADAAPPPPPVGSNIPPGGLTNVRMMSETVTLDVQASTALVEAVFYMRNLGEKDEDMLVRFPLYHDGYSIYSNECGDFVWFNVLYSEIQDFVVWVDGQPVPVTKNYQDVVVGYKGLENGNPTPDIRKIACWVHFPVNFPANRDVVIKVSYTVDDYRIDFESSYERYDYVLETGRGWRGTIGQAEIVMRLAYDVTPMNLESCSPDCTYSGKEIRWHFEDFEPTKADNIRVSILTPAAWQKIQTETRLTQTNPKDGEAWGRLGKAYKEAIWARRGWHRVDPAGKEMYALSQAAYEQAVTLLPGDADWHYGFAQLLCWNAEWGWPDYPGRNLENWRGCADQLRQTLALNPRHSKGTELLDYLVLLQSNMVTENDQYLKLVDVSGSQPDFLILTPQPTPTATSLPPTQTPNPTLTPTWTLEASVDLVLAKPTEKTSLPPKPTQAASTLVAANLPPAATAAATPAAVDAPAPQINIWVGAIAALALIFGVLGLLSLRKR